MTSWYSNILTKTTSQISSLRSTLLPSESDGDTPDDTHVCRVLRNYYVDKGRPRPGWLPPDPKAANQAPQPIYAQPQVGSRYGGLSSNAAPGGGALASLWDNGPTQQNAPPPQSLRAGRNAQQPPPQNLQVERPAAGARTGSYNSQHSSTGGGASAQDRLKQRLYGARSNSPQQSQNSQVPGHYAQGGYGQRQQGLPNGPRGYR